MTDWTSYQNGSAPLDAETAQNWLNQVVATCSTLDPELILDMFTDDVIADLGPVTLTGKEQLRPIIRERYSRYTHYDLRKTVRAVAGDLVISDARLRWKSLEPLLNFEWVRFRLAELCEGLCDDCQAVRSGARDCCAVVGEFG